MARPSWAQLCTGVPPNVTIVLPVRRPALTAGDAGSPLTQLAAFTLLGTHGSIVPTVAEFVFARPIPTAMTNSSTNASAKCMNEPAPSTMIRCQPGCLRNDRASSAGSTTSRPGIPTLVTQPPAGTAFTPSAVSPFRRDQGG